MIYFLHFSQVLRFESTRREKSSALVKKIYTIVQQLKIDGELPKTPTKKPKNYEGYQFSNDTDCFHRSVYPGEYGILFNFSEIFIVKTLLCKKR